MRDAMLRTAEVAAVRWDDLETEAEGTGRLLVRKSKTDQNGDGTTLYVRRGIMRLLGHLQRRDDRVFPFTTRWICKLIKTACESAGLRDGYSGRSPRVGMALDLTRAGCELPALQAAGRWQSPKMPAPYTRNEQAARGAVATYMEDPNEQNA